jgi:ribosome-associated toxin RatA of RatAB toxin-antitoxin module
MLTSFVLRGVLIASALSVTACTIQRAPQMARRSSDEVAPAKTTQAAAAPDPQEIPVAGSEPVAGSDIVRARASVLVRAPVERVRAVIFDCPHYPEFLTSYRACTDVGPGPTGGRVWRMDIEELGGMLKLWIKAEITKVASTAPRTMGETPKPPAQPVEVYEGHLLEGNIRSFASRWRMEPTDQGFTKLTIESHLDPKLPLPSAFINSGSVDGIKEAILAVKRRAERDAGASKGTVLFESR